MNAEFLACDNEKRSILLNETDALITDIRGICICVQTADCVPVFLFDKTKNAVGIIHAGWRGTAQLIVKKTIEAMQKYYHCDPADLIAGIGPSIGPEVYEVSAEVADVFLNVYPTAADAILKPSRHGHAMLNLWEANRLQLIGSGVPAASVEVSGICTFQNHEEFYSSRKNNGHTGRFANGIMLK